MTFTEKEAWTRGCQRPGGEGEWGLLVHGGRVSAWEDKKVLEMNDGDVRPTM